MGQRILTIDDDPNIIRIIKTNLQLEGYEVVGAYDGQSGLDEVANNPPDLIILDIMMPGMDGRQVLRRLKDDSKTAQIPVLMLTALGDAAEIAKSLDRGAEWHLVKPFDIDELIQMVKRLLEVSAS